MQLTGFESLPDDDKRIAGKIFSIRNGHSPFQNGVEFTVSGFDYKVATFYDYDTKKDSKGSRPNPVLTTSVGDLFIKSLNEKFDANGEIMKPDGDLNSELFKLRDDMSNTCDDDVLKKLVKFCKNKTFVVRRSNSFKTRNNFTGKESFTSLVNIDVKNG